MRDWATRRAPGCWACAMRKFRWPARASRRADTCCDAWNSIPIWPMPTWAWGFTTITSIPFRRWQRSCDFSWGFRAATRAWGCANWKQIGAQYGRCQPGPGALQLLRRYPFGAGKDPAIFHGDSGRRQGRGAAPTGNRSEPNMADANLGLGLYNYYVDTLSALAKILRFFMGIPGGDKGVGLRQLETAATKGELTQAEARFNMAKSLRNYDRDDVRAAQAAAPLIAEYPGNAVFLLLI